MLEAVENQSPDVVIVDELSTREECQAARTIMGRGVAVIASERIRSRADAKRAAPYVKGRRGCVSWLAQQRPAP